MHLGIIGGIGPAATVLYYRLLVDAHTREHRRLELTMVHADVGELLTNLRADARAAQAEVFRRLALRLQAAGADSVAVTSMAGHFCVREFQDVSPLPVLSGIEAVRAALARQGCRSVGVLGTRSVMTSGLFGGLDGLDVKLPNADGLDQTDRDYIAMARAGRATEKQRAFFLDMARRLHRDGAEVVLLAGTDLFLAFEGGACEVPTLDCATCHVEAMTQLTRERA